MARSMTAYGRAKMQRGGKDILVEIRSVNNRFFDCSVRISRLYGFLEDRVRNYIREHGPTRGKIDVLVTVDALASSGTEIRLDEAYAESYLNALYRLRDLYSLRDDISVMTVARNPSVFAERRREENAEEEWEDIRPAVEEALASFTAMSESEGARLIADLVSKKEHLLSLLPSVEAQSKEDTDRYFAKLEARLNAVLENHGVAADPARILTECAVFADKVAVDEEIVRLRSHFRAFDDMVSSKEPIGKKLDFLIQEMNRETNTIGSKCCSTEISKTVIEMKNEIEKIREQVQNIE